MTTSGSDRAEAMYRRYCEADLTLQEVGDEFGLSRQGVWRIFKARGLLMHRRGPETGRGAWRDDASEEQ